MAEGAMSASRIAWAAASANSSALMRSCFPNLVTPTPITATRRIQPPPSEIAQHGYGHHGLSAKGESRVSGRAHEARDNVPRTCGTGADDPRRGPRGGPRPGGSHPALHRAGPGAGSAARAPPTGTADRRAASSPASRASTSPSLYGTGATALGARSPSRSLTATDHVRAGERVRSGRDAGRGNPAGPAPGQRGAHGGGGGRRGRGFVLRAPPGGAARSGVRRRRPASRRAPARDRDG